MSGGRVVGARIVDWVGYLLFALAFCLFTTHRNLDTELAYNPGGDITGKPVRLCWFRYFPRKIVSYGIPRIFGSDNLLLVPITIVRWLSQGLNNSRLSRVLVWY